MDADDIIANAEKPKSVDIDGTKTEFRAVSEQIAAVEFSQKQTRQARSPFAGPAFGKFRHQGPVE